jgi:predicted permease
MPSEFVEFIRVAPLPPDARVLTFTMVAALATSIVFGLAPALQTTRANVMHIARGDFGSDFGPARLRRALVIVQITASVTLLITSAVLLQSARHFADVDPGVRTRDVVSIDIREPFRQRVLEGLAASPVVTAIAAAAPTPLNATSPSVSVALPGTADLMRTRYRFVSPGYFDVFDVPIASGRNFTSAEARSAAGVAILSETAARTWWPAGDAIGQSIRVVPDTRIDQGARIRRFPTAQVIGIARDTPVDVSDAGPVSFGLHLPLDPADPGAELSVRVTGETEAARRSLDRSLAVAAPGAVQEIHKLQEFAAGRLYPYRAASWVSGIIGVLALLLTISGIYGVLSYLVAQRAKEIGIRIALGAKIRDVVALVLAQSLRLATIGAVIGVALALGAAKVFGWRIVMLRAFDPTAYVAGVIVVVAACAIASSIPARRAARIDPMTTLRAD